MKRHKYNIFPEMLPEEYGRLKADIKANGYAQDSIIWLYEGAILDGWNREKACEELGVMPHYKTFAGDDMEALAFVMRTNKRRNLTSSQWAAVAVEADELVEAIKAAVEKERRQKQIENAANQHTEPCVNKLTEGSPDVKPERTTKKLADAFNTNYVYVSEAQRLKDTKPEVFDRIKNGEITILEPF